jgi:hypothetical protein
MRKAQVGTLTYQNSSSEYAALDCAGRYMIGRGKVGTVLDDTRSNKLVR